MPLIRNKKERDEYLRTQNRFYIAGWFASELSEPPQAFTGSNKVFQKYYDDYLRGYGDELANAESLGASSCGC